MGSKSEVTVIQINKLPEKITVIVSWEDHSMTVFRHSSDAYKAIMGGTVNGKPVSYHTLRRRLKNNQPLVLDSGVEIRESVLIN